VDLGNILHFGGARRRPAHSRAQGLNVMLFFGPSLFGAGCACWLAGVTALYGALLLPMERH
jgi:hypothetical protein